MNKTFIKFVMTIINAAMNIIGTLCIPYSVGAITMLVLWNGMFLLITMDDHLRTEAKIKKLYHRLNNKENESEK